MRHVRQQRRFPIPIARFLGLYASPAGTRSSLRSTSVRATPSGDSRHLHLLQEHRLVGTFGENGSPAELGSSKQIF